MNETDISDYMEKYIKIEDHDAFSDYIHESAAHQILFEAATGNFQNYLTSLSEAFLLGFLMGHNFHDRCSKS
jgi:hypothetical protein